MKLIFKAINPVVFVVLCLVFVTVYVIWQRHTETDRPDPVTKTDDSLSATYYVVVDDVIVDEGKKQQVELRLREPSGHGSSYRPSRIWLTLDVPLRHHEAAALRRSHGRHAMVEVTFAGVAE